MKKIVLKNQNKLIVFGVCLVISFISLLICSKNSPLYVFNNWVDENAFFTVAKSWVHGIIPYKDIFEQKGPLLYLIFVIAYLISNNSFFGVFILEIISLTVCLYYCSKIITLFLKKNYVFYILPLFSSIICSSGFFVHGGSAEEFCLSLIAISMYYFLKHFKSEEINYKELFLNGIIAGLVSMIKFNLLGFWFSFMMCIFISFVMNRKFKKSIFSCLYFLLGMFIPIFLFAFYFLSVHGLQEFFETYILFNTGSYTVKLAIVDRIKKIFIIFKEQLSLSFIIFNLIDVGIIYFLFNKKIFKDKLGKLSILLLLIFSVLGIYWGTMDFKYYFLFIVFFSIFGLIAFYNQVFENKSLNYKTNKVLLLIAIFISIFLLSKSGNIDYMKSKKNDLVQYKFAKIINSKKNPTLLNYGFLDGGFYFAADVIPNTKYFELQNAPVPNMNETLAKEISNKKFDYIVIRCYDNYDPISKEIMDNYKYVSKGKEIQENIEFIYYLYERK